jgi:hypothetical protein
MAPATPWHMAEESPEGVSPGPPVRPGRERSRSHPELPATRPPSVKKPLPPRKRAPSRGRYIDEYAISRPSFNGLLRPGQLPVQAQVRRVP